MKKKLVVEGLTLSGFRAYLREQKIQLVSGGGVKSLAIFAPNAKGKSSLVDAFEFFFSKDGSLERLGLNQTGRQAGREALIHVKAVENGIEPAVTFSFRGANGPFSGRRVVNDSAYVIPQAAKTILSARQLDFIIRGSQLRYFVEGQSPSERYVEISRWFGLSSLVDIQSNLRKIRLDVKRTVDAASAVNLRLGDLKKATSEAVLEWSEPDVVAWFNKHYLGNLDPDLEMSVLAVDDLAYTTIRLRKEAEEKAIGLTQLKQILAALKKVHDIDGTALVETGALADIETAVTKLSEAVALEIIEKAKSANNVFNDVWVAVQPLLNNAELSLDNCPVCETPFASTAKGSRDEVALHITANLTTLVKYRQAASALSLAQQSLVLKVNAARYSLSSLTTALEAGGYSGSSAEISAYAVQLGSWEQGRPVPSMINVKSAVIQNTKLVEEAITTNGENQSEHTWAKALLKVDELISVKKNLIGALRIRKEMQALHDSLLAQELSIASQLREYCHTVIGTLRTRVNEIFQAVHPHEEHVPEITLGLDPEGKRTELTLTFDFAPNRRGVAPSGYLSDAQVHTLALSLRLAAIEMFNKEVPLVVLDDVMTSYDADHRRAFAGLLADRFKNHQIVIVTHDERFFHYLREQLPSASWEFRRIDILDPDYGPKFHEHNISDEVIESLHSQGKLAA